MKRNTPNTRPLTLAIRESLGRTVIAGTLLAVTVSARAFPELELKDVFLYREENGVFTQVWAPKSGNLDSCVIHGEEECGDDDDDASGDDDDDASGDDDDDATGDDDDDATGDDDDATGDDDDDATGDDDDDATGDDDDDAAGDDDDDDDDPDANKMDLIFGLEDGDDDDDFEPVSFSFKETINNDTDEQMDEYMVSVGFGTGAGFEVADAGDGIFFEDPDSFGTFGDFEFNDDKTTITFFDGSVLEGDDFMIAFNLVITSPLPYDMFTLRQMPNTTDVPEPATLGLVGLGLLGFGMQTWRRRRLLYG